MPAPPSERELELEARVVALEYLLKQCFWQIILARAGQEIGSDGDDAGDLAVRETKLFRKMVVNELRKASFSDADSALSDHLAAVVQGHVERVLGELVQEMEDKLGRGLSSLGNF
jgi:hypothetical protein